MKSNKKAGHLPLNANTNKPIKEKTKAAIVKTHVRIICGSIISKIPTMDNRINARILECLIGGCVLSCNG